MSCACSGRWLRTDAGSSKLWLYGIASIPMREHQLSPAARSSAVLIHRAVHQSFGLVGVTESHSQNYLSHKEGHLLRLYPHESRWRPLPCGSRPRSSSEVFRSRYLEPTGRFDAASRPELRAQPVNELASGRESIPPPRSSRAFLRSLPAFRGSPDVPTRQRLRSVDAVHGLRWHGHAKARRLYDQQVTIKRVEYPLCGMTHPRALPQ